MRDKEKLVFILGYLTALNKEDKIDKERLLGLKKIVDDIRLVEEKSIERLINEDIARQEYEKKKWNDNFFNNDDLYNEGLDMDQQHPDFY
ncbi:hypothetical protein [Mangrovimonas sp. DI 80]|uniref:hypothetical protein n=1 Tax=Mangrovimonas sp. DI 80 TaxID=1779330 RepID=UPI000975BBA1|nr:hypothetical protein [Mangrovimonas sp. DI 80]OMP30649.1 hypothetical protein BKM32_10430 [Mangrovimonas sp. DI 80]